MKYMMAIMFEPKPVRYRVKFLNREATLKAFGLFLRHDGPFLVLEKNVFGFDYRIQLDMLYENKIPYEIVDHKENNIRPNR